MILLGICIYSSLSEHKDELFHYSSCYQHALPRRLFSVSNKAIVVVFLAGRVEAGGGLGDSMRVSPTQSGGVLREVFNSRGSWQGPKGV